MKRFLLLSGLLLAGNAAAQSYRHSAVELGVARQAGLQPQAVGPHNYWYGSQMALLLPTKGDAVDNFAGSANGGYLFTPSGLAKRFGALGFTSLSVISPDAAATEVAEKAQNIIQSSQGFSAGVQTYYMVLDRKYARVTPWATFAYKVNGATPLDGGDSIYLHQGRAWLGVDVDGGALNEGKSPATVTLALTYIGGSETKFERVLGEGRYHPWAIEGTLVIPIADGVGFLLEGNLPFKGGEDKGGRVGLVFASSRKAR